VSLQSNFLIIFGVQEGLDAQLADRKSVRLSGQFVNPSLSNRLSHPKPTPPPRGAP